MPDFRPRGVGWRAIAGAAVLLAGLLAAPPGFAQASLDGLRQDLERARTELAGLRQVQPVQEQEPSRLARVEVRLSVLEEQIRRLTGRIEELEFGQRSIAQRIDRLVSDLDDRLAALERGEQPPAAARGTELRNQSALPALTTRPAVAARPQSEPPAGDAGADRAPDEGTIGMIPERALLNLPRVDPQTATPPPRGNLSPQEQYDAAMELLRAGDYQGAERGLQLFLELNPEHSLAPNAAYWLAETHYVRKNYAAAAAAFARNYRTYGNGAVKGPDNLLKLGMSLHGLGESQKACLSYSELLQEFPNAPAHIQQAVARERDRAECA